MLSSMNPETQTTAKPALRAFSFWTSVRHNLPVFIAALAVTAALAACSPSSTARPTLEPTPAGQQAATAAPTRTSQPAAPSSTPQPPKAGQPTATTQPGAAQAPTATATPPLQNTAVPVVASAFPDPQAYTWQAVVSGLERPLAVTGDGQGRLLVLEQPGRVRLVDASGLLPQPFLDISAQVGSRGNEQGLLGIALHPDYSQNGFFYLNYTDLQGDTVIARFSADGPRASASPDSQLVLLRVDQPFANHNGGSLAFGPDGYLYIGLGDGGSANDPRGYGQNLNTHLGKLLRIDVNQGEPYAVPADNPFQGSRQKPEIWAYGLRNPWRFSFDRATGDLFIGDVGQNTWEEIDFLPAGAPGGTNFGWNYREGMHAFQGQAPADQALVDPVFEYKHPTGCSVSGGYVYRGAALPAMQGIYLFGDFCNGKIWGLLRGADGQWQNQLLFQSGAFLSSFGEDDLGELYITDNAAGVVLKLVNK